MPHSSGTSKKKGSSLCHWLAAASAVGGYAQFLPTLCACLNVGNEMSDRICILCFWCRSPEHVLSGEESEEIPFPDSFEPQEEVSCLRVGSARGIVCPSTNIKEAPQLISLPDMNGECHIEIKSYVQELEQVFFDEKHAVKVGMSLLLLLLAELVWNFSFF